MNVVITLAGHSRRFKERGYSVPKFLIEISGKTMIERVVEMFDDKDNFHFVLNEDQLKEFPQIENLLKSLAKRVSITVIPSHEKGPVFSALQIDSIKEGEEVIVTYCDFLVDWNYKNFLKEVRGYDGAVPSFKGFHPASFGHTYYAYMRINDVNEMLELREKNSFTKERHLEPASSGIYYFKEWSLFKKYANRVMQDGFENLKEGYVSLLFNPMAKDGLKILVNYVNKFICLGTPEDLEQYQFWSKYFEKNSTNQTEISYAKDSVNLIPMAGKGSRFKDYGYRISKPLIQIQKTPMIVKACRSFPEATKWIFMPRADDVTKFPLDKTLKNSFENCVIIPVDHDTSGQLATCKMSESQIAEDTGLFIASSDYETIFSKEKWNGILDNKSIDVAIWTCRIGGNLTKNPKAFAYCVTEKNSNRVTKIVEKDVISDNPGADPLVVGSFWFRSSKDFFKMADEVIEKNITINNEHYVGNGINLMIAAGKKVVIFDIDQWISYGDPFELELFFYWEEFFNKKAER